MKITFTKKLRADKIRGVFATSLFSLSSCLLSYNLRLKHTKLYFYLSFCRVWYLVSHAKGRIWLRVFGTGC